VLDEDQRYVPSEEELESISRMREVRRIVSLVAAGLVLLSALWLGFQRSRRGDSAKTPTHSSVTTNSPSARHSDKP